MVEREKVEADLEFIRGVVRSTEQDLSPAGIYLLWAAVGLVGFSLLDFAPRFVGAYWIVAGPVGGIFSALLALRHARRTGQGSRVLGRRHALHWGGMMGVIFLAVPLGVTGAVSWPAVHQFFLLVIALGYFLAGVHLEPPLLWVGFVMMAAYLALFFLPAFGWTLAGILVGGSLAGTGLARRWRRVPAEG